MIPSKEHPSFDYQKEVERAKWFKEDLDKGDWRQTDKYLRGSSQEKYPVSLDSLSQFWIKTFPEEEVPIKVLFQWKMPIPPKTWVEMLEPSHAKVRSKWDDTFVDREVLETYPDGETVLYMRVVTPWPVADRSFILLNSPIKEIDWYGKQSYIMFQRNITHPSKPEGEDGLVRAYNGGNFYLAVPDENEPEAACVVLGLSNNLFKGWFPDHSEFLMAKLVPRSIDKLRVSMMKGYITYSDYYTKK